MIVVIRGGAVRAHALQSASGDGRCYKAWRKLMHIDILDRAPTVAEFAAITAAVGFKPHAPEAIAIGLGNSLFCACAVADGRVVGVGRIVGDGAMDFYLTGIMVVPEFQRRGIGTRIVEALLARVRQVPYPNTLVEALPLPGLEHFYARFGFKACRQYAPGMHLWLNETR